MKTLKFISIAIFALFLFNSCDEAAELAKIDIDHTHTEVFTVTTAPTDGTFESSFLLDLSENTEIDQYIDKIDKITVNAITYKIVEFPTDLDAGGQVSILASGKTFAFLHESFKADFQNEVVRTFDNVADLSIVANELLATKKITVALSGMVQSAVPVTMKVEVKFDVTVTTKPI